MKSKNAKKGSKNDKVKRLSLIHISEPTRHSLISYAVFCLNSTRSSTSVSYTHLTLPTKA